VKYFVDTEFFEDGKTIDLISLGVVAEDGRELYLCNQEAQLHRVSNWVRKNVLPQLPPYGDPAWVTRQKIADQLVLFTGQDIVVSEFLTLTPVVRDPTKVSFVAYYADYDWVAICQLFGTMMDLPSHFPKWCYDLKQLSVDVGSPKHPPDPKDEHNALADARWNRDLYAFLMSKRSA
jgi:hypothetical protein